VVRGRRVLELGCGVALPGLLAAKHLGARFVALTDRQNGRLWMSRRQAAEVQINKMTDTCIVYSPLHYSVTGL